jgi:hypothetical protein
VRSIAFLGPAFAALTLAVPAAASPTTQLAAVLRAAAAQRSMHYHSVGVAGSQRVSFDGDAARNGGVQRITVRKNGGVGHVTVLLVGGVAYVRGDTFALANFMLIPTATATKDAGRWLRFQPGDRGYAAIAAGITLADNVKEMALTGTIAEAGTTTVGGQHVFAIRSTRTVQGGTLTGLLYARAAGTPLPVRQRWQRGSYTNTITYDRWNEPVRLVAPRGWIRFAPAQGLPS